MDTIEPQPRIDRQTDLSIKVIDGEIGLLVHSVRRGEQAKGKERRGTRMREREFTLGRDTLVKLRQLINEETEYRGGRRLVAFFNELGFEDSYGQDFPARAEYTDVKLAEINGTPKLRQCVRNLLSPRRFIRQLDKLDDHIADFNQHLVFDKWKVVRKQAEITFQALEEVVIEDVGRDGGGEAESIIQDAELAKLGLEEEVAEIVSYRLGEIDRCSTIGAPLAVILLAGSTLEGILLGIAKQYSKAFNTTRASPKDSKGRSIEFRKWSLNDFLTVARELGLIEEDTFKFSQVLRDFRNYIHPLEQLRSGFSPGEDTAKLCLQVLGNAIRQIGQNSGRLQEIPVD